MTNLIIPLTTENFCPLSFAFFSSTAVHFQSPSSLLFHPPFVLTKNEKHYICQILTKDISKFFPLLLEKQIWIEIKKVQKILFFNILIIRLRFFWLLFFFSLGNFFASNLSQRKKNSNSNNNNNQI